MEGGAVMAKYFAVRVSSKDQNYARQLVVAKQYDIPEENILCDKITGRKKERPEYDRMKSLLQRGDEVYFTELDRIGRAKHLIKEELEWFKENGVIVRVLDVPTTLMELPKGQEWVFEMVNNILIEVLGTIAEREWAKTKERREAGIAAMPIDENGRKVSSRTGRGFGRSAVEVDLSLLPGENVTDACERLGISRTTYYRKMNSCRA
jgi:DNA invertase Pin-like site-specific DNA recombinase